MAYSPDILQAYSDDVKSAQLEVEIPSCPSPQIQGEIETAVPEFEGKQLSASLDMKIATMLKLQEQPETVHLDADKAAKVAPLFLIHDGSGICVQYHRLRSFNRTVYAIHDPKFLDPDSWSGIPAMAQHYAQLIARTTSGPCILGGWSFGGVVAFEAARVLMAGGYAVSGVVLIDSPPPLNHKPLSAKIIDAVTKGDRNRGGLVGETIRSLVRKSFTSCATMLGAFNPEAVASTSRPIPRTFLLRSKDDFHLSTINDSRVVENAWLQDRSNPRTSIEGWEVLTKTKMPYMDIPGDHFQVFDVANVSWAILSTQRHPRRNILTFTRVDRCKLYRKLSLMHAVNYQIRLPIECSNAPWIFFLLDLKKYKI